MTKKAEDDGKDEYDRPRDVRRGASVSGLPANSGNEKWKPRPRRATCCRCRRGRSESILGGSVHAFENKPLISKK